MTTVIGFDGKVSARAAPTAAKTASAAIMIRLMLPSRITDL
jgi:hypothetical protein